MYQGMQRIDITGPDSFQVGDIIVSPSYTRTVLRINTDDNGLLYCSVIYNNDKRSVGNATYEWTNFDFPGYELYRPYAEAPYDPTQVGDTEDDI